MKHRDIVLGRRAGRGVLMPGDHEAQYKLAVSRREHRSVTNAGEQWLPQRDYEVELEVRCLTGPITPMEHEDALILVLENGREVHFYVEDIILNVGSPSTPRWQAVTVAEGPDDPTSFLEE